MPRDRAVEEAVRRRIYNVESFGDGLNRVEAAREIVLASDQTTWENQFSCRTRPRP